MLIKNLITKFLNLIVMVIFFVGCNNMKLKSSSQMNSESTKIKTSSQNLKDDRDTLIVRDLDYFKDMLNKCLPDFYIGIESKKTFFTTNKIVIVEYKFKDTTEMLNAYTKVENMIYKTVHLKRNEFYKLCYSLLDENPYYCKKIDLSIYLFTYQGNITYANGNSTINDFLSSSESIQIKNFMEKFPDK
jgi:hypothetical protein